MTSRTSVAARAALTVAATALALAACSGDDGGTSATLGDAPTVTFATTGPPTSPSISPATSPPTSSISTPATAADTTGTGSSPAPTAPGTTTAPTAPLGDPAIALAPVVTVDSPTDAAWRDGDPTMYVVEQAGRIVPVRDGVAGEPVLDITDRVDAGGERGLLGLAFAPGGALAYVNYTDTAGDTVIAELPVGDGGAMDASAERVLLRIDQPYPNHNGGNVMFGPDGFLYIGMGDGGSGGDPQRRALHVGELLGKILRIDPTPSGGNPYTVPADNPFVGVPGARGEIWSVGVRNPWRMSFDPATGDLWFGDVGQGDWEEIDVARASDGSGRGVNFGWSAFEGTHRFNEDQSADGALMPVFEYGHGDGGCSVSGGAVYRGAAIPALVGWYVFGDYCSGDITAIRVEGAATASALTFPGLPGLSAIRAAPDGELHAISLDGEIARLIPG